MKVELIEPELKVKDERAIRKELAALENRAGVLKAEDVVEQARDERSAMHGQFCWDDTAAAHQYRLAQARALIRKIVVTMPDDQAEAALPKYVSLRRDRKNPGGGYRETAQVLNNEELLAELEATAKADIEGVLRRYEMLKGLVSRVRKAAGLPIKPKKKHP